MYQRYRRVIFRGPVPVLGDPTGNSVCHEYVAGDSTTLERFDATLRVCCASGVLEMPWSAVLQAEVDAE